MKRNILSIVLISFLIILIFFYWINLVNALTLDNPLGAENFQELINNIINFVFTLALAITPLMLIIAGFYYIFAAGEIKNIETAHNIIKWTLIGFVIILMSKGIINFLMEKVFNKSQ